MMVFGRSSDPSLDRSIKGKNGRTNIETPPLDEFRAVVPYMEFEPWSLLWVSRNFHLNFAEQSHVRL